MPFKTKIALAALAVATSGLLATNAFARPGPGFIAPANPNQPSIGQRMGNQPIDPTITGTWTPLVNGFPGGGLGPDTALVLTDGSVVMHQVCTPNWYRLIPDQFGSYINGSWSELAVGDNLPLAPMIGSGSAPDGYGPLFYASAVLPDGRLIVNGGEYENSTVACFGTADSTKGSLYNPNTNTWSAVPPPAGWTKIGDANSIVLGTNVITGGYEASSYMIGNCCDAGGPGQPGRQQAVATITPIPGTSVTWTITGAGKADPNSEEGWVLLPNGWLLTVDTQNGTHAERFNTPTNMWVSAGNTPVFLGNNLGLPIVPEMGPGVSIGFGVVVQFGANNHTAVFTLANGGSWTAGPDFPDSQEVADGPAALLPDGNILVQTSVGFNAPSLFWEFPASVLTPQNPVAGAPVPVNNPPCSDAVLTNVPAFKSRMLVLPNGQILWDAGEGFNCTSVYIPNAGDGSPNPTQRPAPHVATISSTTLFRGNTYSLTGSMFRGFSQGATYGDDAQMATNYPLIQITNNASGHVCWGRTHDWAFLTSTQFDVPPAATPASGWALVENPCDTGASTLVLITNGIASNPIAVTIN
jgi:hypothetical protein